MELKEKRELYQKVLARWSRHQVMMAIEETGEMLNALAKFDRGRCDEDEVITELADVSIMMEQMAEMFGYEKFEAEKDRKLNRLKERLEKHELSENNVS